MSLAEVLRESLSNWRAAGDGRHTLTKLLPDHGWAVHLDAERVDTVGALVWELTLGRTTHAPDGLTLKAWADGVAVRATGLLEPLKVLEVDEELLEEDEEEEEVSLIGSELTAVISVAL